MLTIGKLAKHCQVNVETIRYYQRIGLMRIPETTQNYRYYSQQDIETLSFIQKGVQIGDHVFGAGLAPAHLEQRHFP